MFSPYKKILVIDDSIINIKLIEKYLSNSYIQIIGCFESTKAIDTIRREIPDLILLDIHMPELNGFDILKKLRLDPELSLIPVIIITASNEKNHIQQAYQNGIIDYVHKPIFKEELISKVYTYIFHSEEKNILQRYFNIIDNFILTIITNIDFIILYASNSFCNNIEHTKEEIIGLHLNKIFLKNDFWNDIIETLKINNTWKGKIKIKTKNHFFWADAFVEKLLDKKNNLLGYQWIFIDITDKLSLQELAIRDSLTNLYNRNKITELINYEIEKSKRYNTTFSIALIDIDDFKQINDTFGHNFGDRVLKEFAYIMNNSIRKVDTTGRWGGEEFLIIFPQTNIENSNHVVNRIKEKLSKKIVQFNNIIIPMNTASYGLVEFCKGDTLPTLIEKADQALYTSKKNGKNQITVSR